MTEMATKSVEGFIVRDKSQVFLSCYCTVYFANHLTHTESRVEPVMLHALHT